jgi:hypothetical protein
MERKREHDTRSSFLAPAARLCFGYRVLPTFSPRLCSAIVHPCLGQPFLSLKPVSSSVMGLVRFLVLEFNPPGQHHIVGIGIR